jgi:hypothetical protein
MCLETKLQRLDDSPIALSQVISVSLRCLIVEIRPGSVFMKTMNSSLATWPLSVCFLNGRQSSTTLIVVG